MKHLTEPLYKKMQLFQLPLEDGMMLADLEDAFGIEADEFLLQELLARDEWYDRYLPESLRDQLFDEHGEVRFQQLDDDVLEQIMEFRKNVEAEWAKAVSKVRQEKQQLRQTASPELRKLLDMDLADSEIHRIIGIDSKDVQIELYPQWDVSKLITLHFTQVKDSWMGKFNPDDANWWLVDEIRLDDEQRAERYVLQALFGNADYVGQLQLSFAEVQVSEREDSLDF